MCKLWTSTLLKPGFWIRKLRKNNITIEENIKEVLSKFDRNIQVACLYYTCLHQEHILLQTPMADSVSEHQFSFILSDTRWKISDDFKQIIAAAGMLVTTSTEKMVVELYFDKEIITGLPLLMSLLAAKETRTKIIDEYSFWNFAPRYEYEKMFEKPHKYTTILGCLKTFTVVSYSQLCLSFAVDENNRAIIPFTQYNPMRPYKHKHLIKAIHLKAGSDVSGLNNNIAHGFSLCLVISGLESNHISWLIDIMEGSHMNINLLALLSYKLNKIESEKFLRQMSERYIFPKFVRCASSTINADDANKLNDLYMCLRRNKVSFFEECDVSFTCFESDEKLKIKVKERDWKCTEVNSWEL